MHLKSCNSAAGTLVRALHSLTEDVIDPANACAGLLYQVLIRSINPNSYWGILFSKVPICGISYTDFIKNEI